MKTVLLIVAHPDDETLWFYGGLKKLRLKYQIDILCLTYTKESDRGKELAAATADLGCNLIFGKLKDGGYCSLLSNVESCINSVLQAKFYEAVITHPPHGGEKPHPHHIQCFHVARRLAYENSIQFGFFSEKPLPFKKLNSRCYSFNFAQKIASLTRYFGLLWVIKKYPLKNFKEAKRELFFFLSQMLSIENFYFLSFYPNAFQKQSTLAKFESQKALLEEYKAFLSSVEYLYLQKEAPGENVPFIFSHYGMIL